jgi:hypothetical protein
VSCTLATIECPACDHCLERYLPGGLQAIRSCIDYLIAMVDVNTCFVGFVDQPHGNRKWLSILYRNGSLFDEYNLPLIKPPMDHLVWRSVLNF